MASYRSPRIPRIVVTEWPETYDNIVLESEKHYGPQASGDGQIAPYTGRYYRHADRDEAAMVMYLYDDPVAPHML